MPVKVLVVSLIWNACGWFCMESVPKQAGRMLSEVLAFAQGISGLVGEGGPGSHHSRLHPKEALPGSCGREITRLCSGIFLPEVN